MLIVGVARRNINLPLDKFVAAINGFDVNVISTDKVDNLLKVLPNDQEVKAFKRYLADKKNIDVLSEEDKFLFAVSDESSE